MFLLIFILCCRSDERAVFRGGNFALQTKVTKYGLNGKEITMLSAFGAGDKTYYQEINNVLKDQDLVIYVSVGNFHERMGNQKAL